MPKDGSGMRSGSVEGAGWVSIGAIVGEPAAAACRARLALPQHGGGFTTVKATVVRACACEMPKRRVYRGGIAIVIE